MSWIQRVRNIRRPDEVERGIERELEFHLAETVDELRAEGLSEEEARRQARLRLGNSTLHREEAREMDMLLWLEESVQDLRIALRRLRKEPGFTMLAVVSLSLAIGANTAIFGLLGKLMNYRLPAERPAELVTWGDGTAGGIVLGLGPGAIQVFPHGLVLEAQRENPFFQSVAATNSFRLRLSARVNGDGRAEEMMGLLVTGNFFETLGLKPQLGRLLGPADDVAGGHAAVLSAASWRQRFGSDRGVLGRTLKINKTLVTIVGVAPEGFHGLRVDVTPPELFLPLSMQPEAALAPSLLAPGGFHWLTVFGRLKPGVSAGAAQGWVEAGLRRTMRAQEGSELTPERARDIQNSTVTLKSLSAGISGFRSQYTQPLKILWGVVGLVLLVACANLASYTLARQAARAREVAARLALGSGRIRIFRQMLAEGVLLGLVAAVIGIGLAQGASAALLRATINADSETPVTAALEWEQVALALGLGLAAGLLVALLPAWQATRLNLNEALRAGGRWQTARLPLTRILVAGQVALSMVLLVGAGLFLRTVDRLGAQALGFERKSLILTDFDAKLAGFEQEQLRPLYERLQRHVGAIPGVQSVSLSNVPPLARGNWGMPVYLPGRTSARDFNVGSIMMRVTPGYFATAGVPLVAGRAFTAADRLGTTRVAILNKTLARQMFKGEAAVGRFVELTPGKLAGSWLVVGVAEDGKYNALREEAQPMMYMPLDQMEGQDLYIVSMQIRLRGEPGPVLRALRTAFAEAAPELAPRRPMPVADVVDKFMAEEQLIARLCAAFAGLALLLSAIGLYGVMSHAVARRSAEIGIRMALGAAPGRVRALILKDSGWLFGLGVVAGAPLAFGAGRFVQSLLFGVTAGDPATFAGAVAATALVVLTAAWWPARRATRVDPMTTLRGD